MEARPFGIRVILVEPGSIKTNFNAVAEERAGRFAADGNSPYYPYFARFLRIMARATPGAAPPSAWQG